MAYTAHKPRLTLPSDMLRRTIPGWGVDLDVKDRAGYPKERFDPGATGAHWEFPERQEEKFPRERSPEHKFLTPVFGTVCPPSGISGMIRRYAYRLSEGKTSHWMLLVLADRVNVLEARIGGVLRGHPDNLIAEGGLRAELHRHGLRSRIGRDRNDLPHQAVDYVLMAGTWITAGIAVYALGKAVTRGLGGARR